jgi:hypothetical protein
VNDAEQSMRLELILGAGPARFERDALAERPELVELSRCVAQRLPIGQNPGSQP